MAQILVIDDDEGIRNLLRTILGNAGHAVVEAENGFVGVARYQEHSVDLVITDIIMPEMDGIELIAEIRNMDPKARIIVMASGGRGLSAEFTLNVAEDFGVDRSISKPFTSRDILKIVSEILP